ncbi:hypothetical protein EB118_13400 [bacterium]|nr:hypothetical protein [Actinomycetota bacterium]NDG31048.1 hypothetical protein [bacterium]
MSYLSEGTSKTDYGVVRIGNFIEVADGIISLEQDVSPDADVIFNKVDSIEVYDGDNRVITTVTPTAQDGIDINSLVTTGPSVSFNVRNTGVLSLTAGPGIDITQSTGNITVSATGADLISVYGTTTSYTATMDDEYIGVNSASAVTITLPLGVPGRVYYIKDEYGQGSGKITIQPQFGELIDKKNTYVIGVPYQCVACVFRAGGW